jgi:hypothetical protein
MPALIWIGIHIKIILTPELLYGYNFLNKSIDAAAEKVVLNSVWFTDNNDVTFTSEKDKKLQEKVKPFLKYTYIKLKSFLFILRLLETPS